jgi:hypothetical protein
LIHNIVNILKVLFINFLPKTNFLLKINYKIFTKDKDIKETNEKLEKLTNEENPGKEKRVSDSLFPF